MTIEYYCARCDDEIRSWGDEDVISGAFSAFQSFLCANEDEVRVFADAIRAIRLRNDAESFYAAVTLVAVFWARSSEGVIGLTRVSNLLKALRSDQELRQEVDKLWPPQGTAPNSLFRPRWAFVQENADNFGVFVSSRITSPNQDTAYADLMTTALRYLHQRRKRFK